MAMVVCPDCKSEHSTKALACPKCGRHIKDKPRQSSCLGVGCMGLILLFIGAAVWGNFNKTGSSAPALSSPSSATRIGSDAYLYYASGTSSVMLAVSKEAHNELIDRSRAKDTIGMMRMIGDGKVFEAESGSKVRVTGSDTFIRRVRVMSSGKEGWTIKEALHDTPQ